MPTTYILRVTPRSPFAPDTWTGPALHATFLAWIAALDPAFAARLHDHGANKPYVLSDLLRDGEDGLVWRWAALDERTREAMLAVLTSDPRAMSPLGVPCRVTWLPEHPWARHVSYEALFAEAAAPGPLPALQFVGTTSFKVNGVDFPLPLPRLVLRSCLERWNAYAPAACRLPADVATAGESWIEVREADVCTRVEVAGRKSVRGFRGRLALAADPGAPREQVVAVRTLLAYASFAGVGVKTAMGLGQVLPVPLGHGLVAAPASATAAHREAVSTRRKVPSADAEHTVRPAPLTIATRAAAMPTPYLPAPPPVTPRR